MKQSKQERLSLSTHQPLVDGFMYPNNSWYGIHKELIQYAELPTSSQIKAALQHGGPLLWNHIYKPDLLTPFPAIMRYSSYTNPWTRARTKKAIFSIGNPIAYARGLLDDVELQKEKRRLGRNLLVLPKHSTHHTSIEYDYVQYCNYINNIAKNFDTVRVCLYWQDVLLGMDEIFESHGFEVVTAGHMYDQNFMSRLRSILELSDAVTMNSVTSGLGYAFFLGKAVHVSIQKDAQYKHLSNNQKVLDEISSPENHRSRPEIVSIESAFASSDFEITEEQSKLVDKFWGTSLVLSKDELVYVFQLLEEMFIEGEKLFDSIDSVTVNFASRCIEKGNFRAAATLLRMEHLSDPRNTSIAEAYAVSLLQLGDFKTLRDFLSSFAADNTVSLKLLTAGYLTSEFCK